MKTLLKKLSAATAACVLSICSIGSVPANAEEETVSTITVTFDYTSDGAETEDESLFTPIEVESTSPSIIIPKMGLTRDGYYFTGWTYDGIRAYTPGDVFGIPSWEDVTLVPTWIKVDDELHSVDYLVEIDGETIDTSKDLKTQKAFPGQLITVSLMSYSRDDATQYGWEYDDIAFRGQEKFVMPDHDVVLTPHWCINYKITYLAGDVDRINGATFIELSCPETVATSLANSNRFSRNGFDLVGWVDDEGNEYKPLQTGFIMPSHDVTFTAVWKPKTYTVVFKQSSKSAENIKVSGETDTAVTLPEPTVTKAGYYFAGWKQSNSDTIYAAGDEYTILGAAPGLGINPFEAVWIQGEAPETTATVPKATTTTTTTTSTSETAAATTTTTATSQTKTTVYGDSNEDGEVNVADAVLILQSLANPDNFKLSEQAKLNSDVYNHGDGVTAADALVIQQVEAGVYKASELPLKKS